MEVGEVSIGPIRINLPDANQSHFSIFHDLAEVFGLEHQHEASKALKAALKAVKPKAIIDHESDYTHITSANPATIVSVVAAVLELVHEDQRDRFSPVDLDVLKDQLVAAKKNRPKPLPWGSGDIFTFSLADGSYVFGQVLDDKWCTCALLNYRVSEPSISNAEVAAADILAILHVQGDCLNTGAWKVLFKHPILADPNSGHGGRFPGIAYGGGGVVEKLANAYWGLSAWNTWAREDYFDRMLQPGISRPVDAVVLSQDDRKAYRLKHFGVE